MLPGSRLHEIAWAAAALLWSALAARNLRRLDERAHAAAIGALCAGAALCALAGARLHFLLGETAPSDLLRAPEGVVALLFAPGLRIGGGLIAALLFLVAFAPRLLKGAGSSAAVLDRVAPPAGLAIALGRLGCFAAGCCFGTPCDGPACIRFPLNSPAYWNQVARGLIAATSRASLPVHPVQLYLGGAGLLAFLVGSAAGRRARRDGSAALAFAIALCATRLSIEPLRETSFGQGATGQREVDLLALLGCLAWFAWRAYRAPAGRAAGTSARTSTSSSPGTPAA